MDALGWFFFHLLFLGYIEDYKSGNSFALLKEIKWHIYIEVLGVEHYLHSCTQNISDMHANLVQNHFLFSNKEWCQ